jgi:hypothetical protein
VLNVYDGTVTLDERGGALVHLPSYYEALNTSTQYFLSSLNVPSPSLYVKEKVRNNAFVIGGGKPGGRVSWQITGIRHDPYIKQNPIEVEVEKGPNQPVRRGECLYEPNCQ